MQPEAVVENDLGAGLGTVMDDSAKLRLAQNAPGGVIRIDQKQCPYTFVQHVRAQTIMPRGVNQ